MDDKNPIIVRRILEEIILITNEANKISETVFSKDPFIQRAFAMSLLNIGELTNSLDETFRNSHPTVPWHEMRALRNTIAHSYDGLDMPQVWNTIKNDIPPLKDQLAPLIKPLD